MYLNTYPLHNSTPRASVADSRFFLYSSFTGEAPYTLLSSTDICFPAQFTSL